MPGATTRRDRYAAAVKLLVARIEYPHRIRRRTSDAPEVLNALDGAGHDLQERLAETRAWISTESTVLSDVFDHCLSRFDAPFKQACTDAWNATPVTAAAQINLGGFGMGNQQHIVTTMERTLTYCERCAERCSQRCVTHVGSESSPRVGEEGAVPQEERRSQAVPVELLTMQQPLA